MFICAQHLYLLRPFTIIKQAQEIKQIIQQLSIQFGFSQTIIKRSSYCALAPFSTFLTTHYMKSQEI
jgi:hypothetical protein